MRKLIYTNSKGQSVEFVYSTPFLIQKLGDFGGIKNNIFTSKSPNQDGQTFTGSNLDVRNPTISGLIIAKSKGDLEGYRRQLITALNPKLDAVLTYVNDDMMKIINCKAEYAPVFGDEIGRQQAFDITLFCSNPFWQDIAQIRADIALWIGEFTFPLELVAGGIEMGTRSPSLIVDVNNTGDIPCGMIVQFTALATLTNPSIINVNTGEYIKINKTMVAGEVLTISTGFGNKKVTSILNGVTTNAFNYIDLASTFLQLDIGDNLFRYAADTNVNNLTVVLYYTPQYLGV